MGGVKGRVVDDAILSIEESDSSSLTKGSCAGVPPPLQPVRRASGLAEDARRLSSTVGSRSLPDALVTAQGDAQVFHHGTK